MTKASSVALPRIRVNGADEPLAAATIAEFLSQRGIDPAGRGLAVALNGAVVPRAQWQDEHLNEGDRIEIVHARQGG
ncbi:sulfur carrier protein ThiS [Chelatococcus daeguensis]|uniref:Thiamine biosynthesis protein ThiS n=1 Tax=Chelatococcus daeguensis TaxID=444444 RepID=A0AAC9JPS7_9HYPH|nr:MULTISPECIES: sulfur carrier protein ThiS [Chelatococcus]APF37513.1 thiamine biosynthesis protein ThiS [Chelatococcus daeguensis]KZE35447.1 thiamine biosynthesis protein ThiS [Chelatococcus daeguensis]MBM3085437.1 sulfur carrier protein ThiS [Chelatococcus daeguensis]